MQPPDEVQSALERHRAFQWQTAASMVGLVASLVVGFSLQGALGDMAVLGSVAVGSLPMIGVLAAGFLRGAVRDVAVVTAWREREVRALTEPQGRAVSEDPRWQQVTPLLARLRDLVDDDETGVLGRAEAHLTRLQADLEVLEAAAEAQQDPHADAERSLRLQEALERAQAEWRDILGRLRDLHLELSRREGHADALGALDDLVKRETAATEVERLTQAWRASGAAARRQ